MQSGLVVGDDDNQPIVLYQLGTGERFTVSAEGTRGQNPVLAPGQPQFAYAQFATGARIHTIQFQRVGFPNSTSISAVYGAEPLMITQNYPAWSVNNQIAFSAPAFGRANADLWLVDVPASEIQPTAPAFGSEPTITPTFTATFTPTATDTPTPEGFIPSETPVPALDATATPLPPESPLTRLTDNTGNNIWPRFDPTGTAMVYVKERDGVTELYVININNLTEFILTNNGNLLVENHPDWSATGEIVFSATSQGSEGSDIYIMQADGSSQPELLFDFGPNDIRPRFSPDGRYIAFSSDRVEGWDVFIYDRETQAFYGVATDTVSIDLVNDWAE
jgi:hypothetical protein